MAQKRNSVVDLLDFPREILNVILEFVLGQPDNNENNLENTILFSENWSNFTTLRLVCKQFNSQVLLLVKSLTGDFFDGFLKPISTLLEQSQQFISFSPAKFIVKNQPESPLSIADRLCQRINAAKNSLLELQTALLEDQNQLKNMNAVKFVSFIARMKNITCIDYAVRHSVRRHQPFLTQTIEVTKFHGQLPCNFCFDMENETLVQLTSPFTFSIPQKSCQISPTEQSSKIILKKTVLQNPGEQQKEGETQNIFLLEMILNNLPKLNTLMLTSYMFAKIAPCLTQFQNITHLSIECNSFFHGSCYPTSTVTLPSVKFLELEFGLGSHVEGATEIYETQENLNNYFFDDEILKMFPNLGKLYIRAYSEFLCKRGLAAATFRMINQYPDLIASKKLQTVAFIAVNMPSVLKRYSRDQTIWPNLEYAIGNEIDSSLQVFHNLDFDYTISYQPKRKEHPPDDDELSDNFEFFD